MAAVVSDVTIGIACSGLAPGKPQIGRINFNCVAITPANLAAQQSALASLAAALNPLTMGIVINDSISVGLTLSSGLPGSAAVRGHKWVVTAQESTGDFNKYLYTIPAALEAAHVVSGTRVADMTLADWVAFSTAFSAIAKSPAGNALTVLGAELVGRRG